MLDVEAAVENVPGAGGLRGLEHANGLAQRGEPVLLLGTPTTHILLPARGKGGPDRRFAPLAGFGSAPNVLLVPPVLEVRDLAQLIARARRERLVYASAGAGQTIHVCSAHFCSLAGIAMDHREYAGGSATAYADFAAGRVHMYFENLLGCREHIASGAARPLAVSAPHRSRALPQVPTLAECGYPAHALDVWLGAFAANATPDTSRAMSNGGFAARMQALGLEGGPLDGTAFMARIAGSRQAWNEALAALD